MFNKTIFSLLAILLLGVMNFADEIVLQNGLNEYEGCSDTHFRSEGDGDTIEFSYQDINYHSDTHLMTAN